MDVGVAAEDVCLCCIKFNKGVRMSIVTCIYRSRHSNPVEWGLGCSEGSVSCSMF